MNTDKRTELNDADNITGWTDSNKTPALNTTAGQFYEGTGSIETQHTNTAGGDELDTSQTSGGGGTFSLDLSGSTVYYQIKDNLVDSYANKGIMAVLGDGTDLIGFQMGGNDAPGIPAPPYYNLFKFDVSNLPAGSNTTFAGVEANLTLTAITRVGVGTVHLAKAVGNVNNVFCDKISYIANTAYALNIAGVGTVGTPETMADVVADDIANGWGLITNPFGSAYMFFGNVEFGYSTATANTYFEANNEQWYWVGDNFGGHQIGAGNFDFKFSGNTTDTTSVVLNNVSIIGIGAAADINMQNGSSVDLVMTNCSLTNIEIGRAHV